MADVLPTELCRLEDIPDGEAKGFEIDRPEEIVDIIVVRRGGHVYGYRNNCPHIGTPLNWVEDDYMTLDKQHILCAAHGAEFRIEDGYCLRGPCIGDKLEKIEVTLEDGAVVLKKL